MTDGQQKRLMPPEICVCLSSLSDECEIIFLNLNLANNGVSKTGATEPFNGIIGE